MRMILAAALLSTLAVSAAQQRLEPFVPIGVGYDAGTLPTLSVLRDLHTLRRHGFNHIRVDVRWATIEPTRGTYRFEAIDQLLTLADEVDLQVILNVVIDPPPTWLTAEALDPSVVSVLNDAVTARAKPHRSFHALDAPGRPYRASIYPRPATGASWSPAQLAWRLDIVRSAAGDKGWRVGDLQSGSRRTAANPVTAADIRLWGWAAIAHGARAITFDAWRSGPEAAGLLDAQSMLTDRARAAAEFAGLITRNSALFAPLRPRPSRVAVVYNPVADGAATAAPPGRTPATELYQRLFERNIQADIIPPDEILTGGLSKYAVVFLGLPESVPPPIVEALKAYTDKGGTLVSDMKASLSDAPALQPDIRIDGGGGLVETRLLESVDALLLVAINHADSPQAVTFTFAPDTPEAIWQNMETGGSVSFLQGPGGLTHKHAFAARDVMVLMIRKRLR